MAGVQIGLIILFLLFFILTRKVWVKVIKEEEMIIEIHLPLLAICLYSRDKEKRKSKNDRLSIRAYMRIIAATLQRVKDCTVIVRSITLPLKIKSFDGSTLVKPFAYQGAVYAILAYLKTMASSLTLCNNAITSSPDIDEAQYYITVKLRLFQLIYALLTFRRGVKEEKRAKRIKYVGE